MMKTKTVPFVELRRLLLGLGYREKQTDSAEIFYRSDEDMHVFRRYRDEDPVRAGDLAVTRNFLDMRGYLDGAEFDAFLERATTSA